MFRMKLSGSMRGIAPTISTMLMLGITVASMLIVTSVSLHLINQHKDQMGERMVLENVILGNPVMVFVRNIGPVDITLDYPVVNGEDYSFGLGDDITIGESGQYLTIVDFPTDPGVYRISFISMRGNELGITEVER